MTQRGGLIPALHHCPDLSESPPDADHKVPARARRSEGVQGLRVYNEGRIYEWRDQAD